MRKISFLNNEYYHIFNRGVDKRPVFLDKNDFWKFFDCVRDLNNETFYEDRLDVLGLNRRTAVCTELSSVHFRKLGRFLNEQDKIVDVVSYSFNPNHFHFIIDDPNNNTPKIIQGIKLSFSRQYRTRFRKTVRFGNTGIGII